MPRPGSFGAWMLAARLKTLPVAVAPVAVGAALAHVGGLLQPWPALAALVGALLIQIGTNFANDVFDYEKGADDETRLGPLRAAQAGLLTPSALRRGMVTIFALAVGIGAYLVSVGGWPIIAIGVLSILSGIAYTGGPYPLGYHGLGDVFVFVFFGCVATMGTAFVAHGSVPAGAWLASFAVGALSTAVLVVNNVRDHETDVHAGKRTLVVRFGRRFGVVEYAVLLVVAFASTALLAWELGRPWALLSWLPLPLSIRLARAVAVERGEKLNAVLAATAKLLLIVSALLVVGLAL